MSIFSLLPSRLKAARQACHLTLEQAAEASGLSVSFLSDMERGRTNPSLETLVKLAACYQTTPVYLFTEADASLYVIQVRLRLLEQMRAGIDEEITRLRSSIARVERKGEV